MASLKQLASQTAIYGLSSIVGRLLNFLLTPLHTHALPAGEYGQNVDVYTMIMFLMVIMNFAMETTFFKFYRDHPEDKNKIFSHTTGFVLFLSLLFIGSGWAFLEPLARVLRYEEEPHFIMWLLIITATDAIAAVPFAKLRAENRPLRFVVIRMSTTLTIVLLNLVFFMLLPWMQEQEILPGLVHTVYHPEWGVAYIFIANLIGNGVLMLLFAPELLRIRWSLDRKLMRRMLVYSAPLVISFLAGKTNELADKFFLKYLLPEEAGFEQIGILGANLKIATFMMLFIQAFRFAAEPFFFSGDGNFKEQMAKVMRYFTAAQALIYLGIVCFLDVVKYFIDDAYWEGLVIVPIMTMANVFLGIIFNLNIWYKLRGMTRMGAYITFVGLSFSIASNLVLIPRFGYIGAAWSTLISYTAMMLYSYYLNQKYDHTRFPVGRMAMHLGLSLGLSLISFLVFDSALLPSALCFTLYALFVGFTEGPSVLKAIKR